MRNPDHVPLLVKAGITPVTGELDDADLLTAEAERSDGVVNTANSDHRGAVEALLRGLRGSGKPLLHTSGTSIVGDDAKGEELSPSVFENGEASFAEIGTAVADRLGLGPVEPWPLQEAAVVWGEGFARFALGSNSRVLSTRAKALGWTPEHASITAWIRQDVAVR